MNDLRLLFSVNIQNQEGEVKTRQEEEVKERSLPFDIVKTAFSNLHPETVFSPVQLHERISKILTDLSNKDLNILETLPNKENNTILFASISDLVKIYKRIKTANEIPNTTERGTALESIVIDLIKAGDLNKADEVANTIPSDKKWDFDTLLKTLVINNIDKAIEVANKIPDVTVRSSLIYSIVEDLIRGSNIETTGNIDKAIKLANIIPIPYLKEHTIKNISQALAAIGNIDKATELASVLPDAQKSDAFFSIVKALIKSGDLAKAIKIANAIPDAPERDIRNSALHEISIALAKAGNIPEAIAIANTIEETSRMPTMAALSKVLIDIDIDKAIELAKAISDSPLFDYKGPALQEIAKVLGRVGRIPEAIAIANTMQETSRGRTMKDLSELLVNIDIDKAIELATTILENPVREEALKLIISTLLTHVTSQNVQKATAIANTETNASIKTGLRWKIRDILEEAEKGG